jgi:tetratricopeptide (TPR) repeat protein
VARGAALHSFFLHGLDRPLLHPIAQETIGRVAEGHAFVPLIPAGTELPFPPDGSLRPMDDLVVPRDLMKSVAIVLAADSAEKVLNVAHLAVPGVRSAGQEIKVGYRLDANKVLELHACLAGDPSARCEIVLENPLCSTRVRSSQERRILELERTVKRVGSDSAKAVSTARELTSLCYAERSFERSIDWGRQVMATLGRPDASILFTMALAYERLNATDRAERCYREATKANANASSSWFNLGLLLTRQGRLEEAWQAMDEACRVAPRAGGYRAARGWVAKKRALEEEAISDWEEAARIFDAEGLHDEFDRSWRRCVAEWLGDRPLADKLKAPLEEPAPATPYDPRMLPALRAGMLVTAG